MAEKIHNHDNCPHGRHHRDDGYEPVIQDAASQSLAKALKASFRLLSLIMILIMAAFLATGLKTIKQNQRGIIKMFGRVVGEVGPGLAHAWPFPIGEIDVVDVSVQKFEMDDFWINETAKDLATPWEQRTAYRGGLKPGLDGMLITGDRAILHMKLACSYQVSEPIKFRESMVDPEATVRSVICSAAIKAVAHRTASAIMTGESTALVNEIKKNANDALGEGGLDCGIVLTTLSLPQHSPTWPLGAKAAFDKAQNATNVREGKIKDAYGEAKTILQQAAGNAYKELVGSFEPTEEKPTGVPLIVAYEKARENGNDEEAAIYLEKINNILLSGETGGEAKSIIEDAKAYRTGIVQAVQGRAEKFEKLLPEFRKYPDLMVQRLWAETVEEILSSPTVEKIIIRVGDQVINIQANQPPAVARKMLEEAIKKSKEQNKKEGEK